MIEGLEVVREGLYRVVDEISGESFDYNGKDLEYMSRVMKGVKEEEAYLEVYGGDEGVVDKEIIKMYTKSSRIKRLKHEVLKGVGIDLGVVMEVSHDILVGSKDDKARIKVVEMEMRRHGLLGKWSSGEKRGRLITEEERAKIDYLFDRESKVLEAEVEEVDGGVVDLGGRGESVKEEFDIFGDIGY